MKDKVLTKEISEIHAKILRELLLDGRKTSGEIAKKLGLKKEIVNKNYHEMEIAGIIKGATIHVNYRCFGYKAVANLIINVEPQQADQLLDFISKMQDIYTFYSHGPKGNLRVVAILKTLQQLDAIKDAIKRRFSILGMKTVIWTDVREMHENLAITQSGAYTRKQTEGNIKTSKAKSLQKEKVELNELDLKISNKLSEDGRAPISRIALEIGASASTVKQRYEKLKKNGLLKVTIQIDPTKLGYRAMAIFYITLTLHETSSTIEEISRIPDTISIMKTIGDYDLQVYVMIRDIDQLLTIQDAFSKISSISKIDMDISEVLEKWPTPRQYISTF